MREAQDNFAIASRPWKKIAQRLSMPEKELIGRIKELMEEGFIRYVGAAFNLSRMGLKSTLIAMKAPPKKIKQAVEIINNYPQVSHNYLRSGAYNVWFTITADGLNSIIRGIRRKTGINDMLDLRTEKVFKLNTTLKTYG